MNIRRLLPILPALAVLCSCASAVKTVKSPSLDSSAVKRVAVAALSGPYAETGQSIADSMVPDLMDMGFAVIERARLEGVLKEQSLQMTGVVDPDTLKKVGLIAGVDAVLMGDYTAHTDTTVSRRGRVRRGLFRRRVMVRGATRVSQDVVFDSLSLRLVSIQTGEVLLSSTRREQFGADELDSVLEEMSRGMKKALGREK
jgi:curli biogenesis system outer membrane secretion channel CsgG